MYLDPSTRGWNNCDLQLMGYAKYYYGDDKENEWEKDMYHAWNRREINTKF